MKGSKALLTLGVALACAAISLSLAVRSQAQTYTNLDYFNKQDGWDGAAGPMIQGTDGNFYGATIVGGANVVGPVFGGGNVFQLSPSGDLRSIYSFCSQPNCADGQYPLWGPVLASDGNLYGVASVGGSYAGSIYGSGTFYKLTLGGEFTLLYTFCPSSPCTDGDGPNGIILGSDGNFYGATAAGGEFGGGTVFQISSTGKLTVLHSFCSLTNCKDGKNPQYPPIQASNGNFYGTTLEGGSTGGGGVYELTPSGTYTVIHNFCSLPGCTDGEQPTTIVQGADGNIFGATVGGGSKGYGWGTVFEITSTNQYIVLDSFDILRAHPFAGLALANDGNFYGTTMGAGTGTGINGGTVFEVTPEGRYTQLYTFSECKGGYNPSAPLFQGTDGLIYGTTAYGGYTTPDGCGGYGTIFTLANGLGPLVKTVPVAGPIGQSVLILGNGLTGSTSVTFDGVEAAFTVESDTYIKATVPTGATTGAVSVVTPSGTLNSNPQFVVTK
jgi:uncharacterized repeat protein (TIGR03803 family)